MQPARELSLTEDVLLDPVEAEYAKDTWDVRNLPGVRHNLHAAEYYMRFGQVPVVFRPLVKTYIRRELMRYSKSSCETKLRHVIWFLKFMVARYPQAQDLNHLSRQDIEAYLSFLKTYRPIRFMGVKRVEMPISVKMFYHAVMHVELFLQYLQRTTNPASPLKPISQLIWRDDRGPARWGRTEFAPKSIPEVVLHQLDQHIDQLTPSHLVPVVIVLRASGWRISDVLNLRHDTCLDKTSSGWWLVGDIVKTQVKGHRVPISEEIATIVAAQRAFIRAKYTSEENPYRYLFPATYISRRGMPMLSKAVREALRRFATKFNITDETGQIYHFRCHAFRHTKAVELINNGMSLINVQKWMAHQSPEMTMVYAKILDTTLREEWEKAFKKGVVTIDTQGQPQPGVGSDLGEWEHMRANPNSFRLRDGYCFLPKKMTCPSQLVPCHNCVNFRTTPAFLPQFQQYRQEIEERIGVGEQAGNTQWAERNRQLLQPIIRIVDILGAGKSAQGREEQPEPQEEAEHGG